MIESKSLGEVAGFEIEAGWIYDDVGPDFYGDEVYDDQTIEAYENNEWHFVVLIVEARFNGHVMGTAYLGGVEVGFFPGVAEPLDHLTNSDYLDDMIAEAVNSARTELQETITKGLEVLL